MKYFNFINCHSLSSSVTVAWEAKRLITDSYSRYITAAKSSSPSNCSDIPSKTRLKSQEEKEEEKEKKDEERTRHGGGLNKTNIRSERAGRASRLEGPQRKSRGGSAGFTCQDPAQTLPKGSLGSSSADGGHRKRKFGRRSLPLAMGRLPSSLFFLHLSFSFCSHFLSSLFSLLSVSSLFILPLLSSLFHSFLLSPSSPFSLLRPSSLYFCPFSLFFSTVALTTGLRLSSHRNCFCILLATFNMNDIIVYLAGRWNIPNIKSFTIETLINLHVQSPFPQIIVCD